jgi:hypothetical protein
VTAKVSSLNATTVKENSEQIKEAMELKKVIDTKNSENEAPDENII